jgi:hypothetical protein
LTAVQHPFWNLGSWKTYRVRGKTPAYPFNLSQHAKHWHGGRTWEALTARLAWQLIVTGARVGDSANRVRNKGQTRWMSDGVPKAGSSRKCVLKTPGRGGVVWWAVLAHRSTLAWRRALQQRRGKAGYIKTGFFNLASFFVSGIRQPGRTMNERAAGQPYKLCTMIRGVDLPA